MLLPVAKLQVIVKNVTLTLIPQHYYKIFFLST